MEIGQTVRFNYKEYVQLFRVTEAGRYRFCVAGSAGADCTKYYPEDEDEQPEGGPGYGGAGGIMECSVDLEPCDLYIYCGGRSEEDPEYPNKRVYGGWPNGGDGSQALATYGGGGGGGSSHVAFAAKTLSTISDEELLVAAGGGGWCILL